MAVEVYASYPASWDVVPLEESLDSYLPLLQLLPVPPLLEGAFVLQMLVVLDFQDVVEVQDVEE